MKPLFPKYKVSVNSRQSAFQEVWPEVQQDKGMLLKLALECCLPHQGTAVQLLVISSHSESTGRKAEVSSLKQPRASAAGAALRCLTLCENNNIQQFEGTFALC